MNNITKDVLREVINEWDPIDLLSIAPEDEYDPEINEILKIVTGNEVDKEQLAIILQEVFIQYFNEDLFDKNVNECEMIANKVLDLSSKQKKCEIELVFEKRIWTMAKKEIKNRNISKLNISLENPKEIERFVLITIVGLLNSLQHNVVSIEDTECRFFSPYTYNMLKKMNVKKDIVELVMDGCLLEDFESIIPDKLDNEIIRIKEKALSLLNKHKNDRSNVDTYHWIDNNK